jgi:sulfate adenylyltransferase subunit 2
MSAPEHLHALESEAIHIMREVAAELERPVLMFSGGKDSIVLLRLAEKAFRPGPFPFPVLHVDTGHNFPEVLEYRDRRVQELGEKLIVAKVQDTIDAGRAHDEWDPRKPGSSRNRLQTITLLDALEEHRFDAAFGGARRDEERARAKERVFSFRDELGQWDPRAQRPELWNLYNGRIRRGEHVRVFPISNWTELDVWRYIEREELELPSIYFAHDAEFSSATDAARRLESRARARASRARSATARRRHDVTGAVRPDAADSRRGRRDRATRVTERGETRATTDVSEAPWRTASARATSDGPQLLRSRRAARSTTASRR